MPYDDYKREKSKDTQNLVIFLASLCFFLSVIENSIPKPLPFMRLGLANASIVFALFLLKTRDYFFLVCIKILGQAILSGTLFSYILLFSAGGSFASALAMFALYRLGKKHVSCLGISLFGALANTIVQYFLARYLLFGSGAILIAPLLMISGSITGIVLGLFSEIFLQNSEWFLLVKEGKSPRFDRIKIKESGDFKNKKKKGFRIKALVTPLLVFASIVLFNLFQAHGKVLLSFWGFDITSGALLSGIKRASILTGMVFISKLIVSSSFRLPGKWGAALDHIFYYLAMLTEKKIEEDRDFSHNRATNGYINENLVDTNYDRQIKEKCLEKPKKRTKIRFLFSKGIFKAIDARLLEVYF